MFHSLFRLRPLMVVLVLCTGALSLAQQAWALQKNGLGVASHKLTPGEYTLDKTHASVIFMVNHLGFSNYIGRFNQLDATLTIDAEKLENSKLDVIIQAASVDTNNKELEEKLRAESYFNAEKFPTITFSATKIEVTGEDSGKVTGYLTLLGETKPIMLDVTFNKQGVNPASRHYTMGFSARGVVKRSEFGMNEMIPLVGEYIDLIIEAEFYQKPEEIKSEEEKTQEAK